MLALHSRASSRAFIVSGLFCQKIFEQGSKPGKLVGHETKVRTGINLVLKI